VLTARFRVFLLVLVLLFTHNADLLAQPRGPGPVGPRPGPGPQQPTPTGGAEAGACACGFLAIWLIVIGIIIVGAIALKIFMAVWVSKDAKARGMDNASMYVLLVVFLDWIGLIIYLASRPQGTLYPCPDCGRKRSEASRRCPHCGGR
jgi:hypothetical protein